MVRPSCELGSTRSQTLPRTIAAAIRAECKKGYLFPNQAIRADTTAKNREGFQLVYGCVAGVIIFGSSWMISPLLPGVGSRLNRWGGDLDASFFLFR